MMYREEELSETPWVAGKPRRTHRPRREVLGERSRRRRVCLESWANLTIRF